MNDWKFKYPFPKWLLEENRKILHEYLKKQDPDYDKKDEFVKQYTDDFVKSNY